jgi:hypothetical protein
MRSATAKRACERYERTSGRTYPTDPRCQAHVLAFQSQPTTATIQPGPANICHRSGNTDFRENLQPKDGTWTGLGLRDLHESGTQSFPHQSLPSTAIRWRHPLPADGRHLGATTLGSLFGGLSSTLERPKLSTIPTKPTTTFADTDTSRHRPDQKWRRTRLGDRLRRRLHDQTRAIFYS